MPKEIVSSFEQVKGILPKGAERERENARIVALQHYLSKGGVLHIAAVENSWPRLLYPSRANLRRKIDELRALREQYASRLDGWRKKFNDARVYHRVHNIKKFKEPLFWQHVAKCAVDNDYRKDSEKVRLPAHLVGDARWKPMVRMFVSDIEYRKQLVQTVEESIVYKKNRRVAQYADLLQQFRMEQSNKKIEELQKKLDGIDADISAMQELARWASL